MCVCECVTYWNKVPFCKRSSALRRCRLGRQARPARRTHSRLFSAAHSCASSPLALFSPSFFIFMFMRSSSSSSFSQNVFLLWFFWLRSFSKILNYVLYSIEVDSCGSYSFACAPIISAMNRPWSRRNHSSSSRQLRNDRWGFVGVSRMLAKAGWRGFLTGLAVNTPWRSRGVLCGREKMPHLALALFRDVIPCTESPFESTSPPVRGSS